MNMAHAESQYSLPSKEQYFKELQQTPAISWPAIGVMILGLLVIGAASTMALSGIIPLWGGMLANGLGLYLLFSIMHEACTVTFPPTARSMTCLAVYLCCC